MSLPIRIRLTVWYACLLTAIIVVLGGFLVLQLRSHLNEHVDGEVRSTSETLIRVAMTENADNAPGQPLVDDSEDFAEAARAALPHSAAAAQVVDSSGRVVIRYGPVATGAPLADRAARSAAFGGDNEPYTVHLGSDEESYRIQVSPFPVGGETYYMVVAQTLEPSEDAVASALTLLLVAGPLAIAGTAAVAYWLAYKAMRPVEQMASDAEEIGVDQLHDRVAVPSKRDEISHLAVTLNAMLDRIEQGVAEKHRLVADASHELRTPLAIMRAEIQVSLLADDLPDPARQVLESTRDEVEQMSRTVDNLLTLAEADEGHLTLLTQPIGLRATLEQAARPLEPLAAAKQVVFVADGEEWSVQADPPRLTLALTNLLENAVKFSPPGGTVRVATWRDGGEVGISVSDEGPGIAAEDKDRLFDRFYRVDTARSRGIRGSGLGLAICLEVATAHEGRLWVDSDPPHGSTFYLALPDWRLLAAEQDPTMSLP